jgi:hypothetical protein
MNLNRSDRAKKLGVGEVHASGGAGAASLRYLNSQLGMHGVGSKNACFYLGSVVHVRTHPASDASVHELKISAAELAAAWHVPAER